MLNPGGKSQLTFKRPSPGIHAKWLSEAQIKALTIFPWRTRYRSTEKQAQFEFNFNRASHDKHERITQVEYNILKFLSMFFLN